MIDGQLRANTWRTVRRLCTVAYFTVLVLFVAIDGIPTGRALIMAVVVAGLGIGCIGSGWRRFAGVIVDWLPFSAALILYDLSRGVATVVHLPLHERDVASAESRLFGGVMPPVWLQNQLYDPNVVHWYDALATLVYFTHFIATPALAAVLWLRRREMWVAGLVTYVLFPEAPPWFAARDGVIDPVARLSTRGWAWFHADHLQDLVATVQRDGANPVAAMPSLHTAFAMLAALFIASRTTSRWRYLLYLYPALMGVVLVYTGEHYVLDTVVGIGYAIVVHRLAGRWERSRAPRSETARPEPVSVGVMSDMR